MFDGGVISVTTSQEIVVIVTPMISFSSTEKLFGMINSNIIATTKETIIAVNSL